MSAIDPTTIYAQAREAITGDPSSAKPTDAQLQYRTEDAIDQVLTDYPCISDGAGGTNITDALQLRALYRALGYRVGAAFLASPMGKSYMPALIEVKIGPVTEKSAPLAAKTILTEITNIAVRALKRIPCIASAIGVGMSTTARSGPNVDQPHARTAIDQAFGPNGDLDSGDEECP